MFAYSAASHKLQKGRSAVVERETQRVRELEAQGVRYVGEVHPQAFEAEDSKARRLVTDKETYPGDLFFVGTGVVPNAEIAGEAGIRLGLTGGIEPHRGRNVWHSSGQLHLWNPRQKAPETAWEKEIDDIFERAACELENAKRKVLYDRWQMIVSEEVPVVYLVNPAALYAVRNRFGNLRPTGYGGVFHNIEEIYTTTK